MTGDGRRQESLNFSLYKIGGGKYLSLTTDFLSYMRCKLRIVRFKHYYYLALFGMCWIFIVGSFLSGEFQGRGLRDLDTYLYIYINNLHCVRTN